MGWTRIRCNRKLAKICSVIDEAKECSRRMKKYVHYIQSTDSISNQIDNCKQYMRSHDSFNHGLIGLNCLRHCELILEIEESVNNFINLFN